MVAGTDDIARRCTDNATDRFTSEDDNFDPNIIRMDCLSYVTSC